MSFHHGEAVTDAHARPAAERNIAVLANVFRIFGAKTLWSEGFRFVPKAWVTMNRVAGNTDAGSLGRKEIAQLHIVNRHPSKEIGWWEQAHRLFDDHFRVR